MIAEPLISVTNNRYDLKPVLDSMKTIEEGAEYYSLLGEHVCLYILTGEEVDKVIDMDWKYVINGKVYRSLVTNKLEFFLNEENAE